MRDDWVLSFARLATGRSGSERLRASCAGPTGTSSAGSRAAAWPVEWSGRSSSRATARCGPRRAKASCGWKRQSARVFTEKGRASRQRSPERRRGFARAHLGRNGERPGGPARGAASSPCVFRRGRRSGGDGAAAGPGRRSVGRHRQGIGAAVRSRGSRVHVEGRPDEFAYSGAVPGLAGIPLGRHRRRAVSDRRWAIRGPHAGERRPLQQRRRFHLRGPRRQPLDRDPRRRAEPVEGRENRQLHDAAWAAG